MRDACCSRPPLARAGTESRLHSLTTDLYRETSTQIKFYHFHYSSKHALHQNVSYKNSTVSQRAQREKLRQQSVLMSLTAIFVRVHPANVRVMKSRERSLIASKSPTQSTEKAASGCIMQLIERCNCRRYQQFDRIKLQQRARPSNEAQNSKLIRFDRGGLPKVSHCNSSKTKRLL